MILCCFFPILNDNSLLTIYRPSPTQPNPKITPVDLNHSPGVSKYGALLKKSQFYVV
jgi:hypothetical protein